MLPLQLELCGIVDVLPLTSPAHTHITAAGGCPSGPRMHNGQDVRFGKPSPHTPDPHIKKIPDHASVHEHDIPV